jgi:hypothetical protein
MPFLRMQIVDNLDPARKDFLATISHEVRLCTYCLSPFSVPRSRNLSIYRLTNNQNYAPKRQQQSPLLCAPSELQCCQLQDIAVKHQNRKRSAVPDNLQP